MDKGVGLVGEVANTCTFNGQWVGDVGILGGGGYINEYMYI